MNILEYWAYFRVFEARLNFQRDSSVIFHVISAAHSLSMNSRNRFLTFSFEGHITWVLSDMGRDRRVIYSVSGDGVPRGLR